MPQFAIVSKFVPGRIVITANAARLLSSPEVASALRRHLQGDWGDLASGDRHENDRALLHGGRLCSAYRTANGTRFYIITEADRSATTLLLPEDY